MSWEWGLIGGQAVCVTLIYALDPPWMRGRGKRWREALERLSCGYIFWSLTLEVGALLTLSLSPQREAGMLTIIVGAFGLFVIATCATVLFTLHHWDSWSSGRRPVTVFATAGFLFWSWTAIWFVIRVC